MMRPRKHPPLRKGTPGDVPQKKGCEKSMLFLEKKGGFIFLRLKMKAVP